MKNKRAALTSMIVFLFSFIFISPSEAATPLVNKSCTKLKAISISDGKKLICVSKSGKKVWALSTSVGAKPVPSQSPEVSLTVSQINADLKAKSYLRYSSFSRSGLISQLEFEGFSTADAIYGTDKQNANWSEQSALKAKSYLRTSAFSRSGLISQLEFEGFSTADAIYGTDKQNANWNEQSALKAKSYLRTSAFSRSGLISQLEFEGFTTEQAIYGVNLTGL